MGCGASVSRSRVNGQKPSAAANQRTRAQTQISEVPNLMASLQGHMPHHNIQGDEETKMVHTINLNEGLFPEQLPERIECDDIIEFQIQDRETYDIYQVYKDGNDYYRVNNGYELKNIKNRTPDNERRLILSLALNSSQIDLYFCILPSAQREKILAARKCPKGNCETNRLIVQKCEIKFPLSDDEESHKVYLHKGDTVEIDCTSKSGVSYRVEERKYCPMSGGLYTVEPLDETLAPQSSARGKFTKTFIEFGMSFLFRLTETNQIHDVIVCIVNDTYKVKHVEIKDTNIEPNIIWLEQSDWIAFEWNAKRKQTVVQIEPYSVDEDKRQSIELKTEGQHFYWPNEPSKQGFMVHQFNETGLFCYKNGSNQIGTIIVEPRKNIHHVPIFGEQLTHKINTKDLIQFDWKMTDSEEVPVVLTIDYNSSVAPDAAGGVKGIFDCAIHKCKKVEPFFRHHFHTCEVFLLNIPQHGLYNFTVTENADTSLISVIVENGIDNHRVVYDENNQFEPNTLVINRGDQVWLDSLSTTVGSIHQTDEFGNRLEAGSLLFQPQENSVNYFMKDFQREGVFYFSIDSNNETDENLGEPLAVIVVPNVRFHYQLVYKNGFDSTPILTNVNDFVIWQFDHLVSHSLVQVDPSERIQELIASHERAIAGRNRQCLAVECTALGTFFFTNPEFERGTGLGENRLVSTVIVDPPFSQHCFIVTNNHFIPAVLDIAQNDTISWTIVGNNRDHQIYIQSNDQQGIDEGNYVARDIDDFVHNVHHLHTFHKPGQYIVRSNRFHNTGTVNVYSELTIRSRKKRVQEPEIIGEINTVNPFGTQVHLDCSDRNADTYYTLDGSSPTRHLDNVQLYNPDTGVVLNEPGLHVIRVYSVADQKISSPVTTSHLTFVLENKELEAMEERRGLWSGSEIKLSTSLQRPNKLFGKIEVEPMNTTDFIDHYEVYVNGVPQKKTLPATDVQFSAEGFSGGEQYEVKIVAFPKTNITDAAPIVSNSQAFEIQREISNGAPLVSLSISKDPNDLHLLWAHIGDHVSEYIVYVDGIEIKTISEKEFNSFYAIQFHSAQQKRKYLLHVDAKMKNNGELRKSNTVPVIFPLDAPVKGEISGRHFPYIIINNDAAPTDVRLEAVQLSSIANPQPAPERKSAILPITSGLRNAVPRISYKRNPNGVTLFWKTTTPAIVDSIEHYRIVVDNEPYGKLISPLDETKYQINLTPGTHECHLDILPKDKSDDVYKSNVLKIDIPASSGARQEGKQQREPTNAPIYQVLEQKDVPIPKLNIQSINSSAIRANWYLDRSMPSDVFVAFYEVHVRGQDFPVEMKSDEYSTHSGYIEHVWHTQNPPLEINGISDRQEYTIFVRAFFHVQGVTDIDYLKTTSNEVTTTRIDPLIDLLPRPVLKVTRVGLQMVSLAWEIDGSVDQALVKGYRIILNSKPTEILPSNQHEYELTGLKPGTENDVQVSVTSHPDFVDEKISEPIRIACPARPQPPKIESIKADKPFSITIKWKLDRNDNDELNSFKVFLNGKLHEEIETNGRQSFKYDFNKLQTQQTYSIYLKSVVSHKKLEGYTYQCDIESSASNELALKCAAPPKGTTPRLEQVDQTGIQISWDASQEYGDVKLTGYQILRDNRAIGKPLPVDRRRYQVEDLKLGQRYSFQVVPITDQPGGTLLRVGEEYNPDRHGHYLPGPKLDVEYADLIQVPSKFWVENIAGKSALVCWSSLDQSSSSTQPDGYKLHVWNNEDIKRDKPMIVQLGKDKISALLKNLKPKTMYEVQLEAIKNQRHQTTNDQYLIVSTSEVVTFETGSPPDPPANLRLIACTNTDARIGFDPFIEHNAEVKTIRVQCEPISSETTTKEISFDIPPNATDFSVNNLIERSDYKLTVYGLTEEYLEENRCREFEQLPKKLKPSDWLPSQTFEFKTSGFEPVTQLNIRRANTESIELDWTSPKVYGSTRHITQILRWKLDHGGEEQRELDRNVKNATIPGPLPSGSYKIFLDSIFSVRVNLEDADDETTRNEISLTVSETISVRFRAPGTCERPEIYLTGYTTNTIDLSWNKPNLFNIIDHPEKINEQLKIHRRLLGYRVDINGHRHDTLDKDQYRCTLTECNPGETYEVQLTAQTIVQNEFLHGTATNETDNTEDLDETPSEKLRFHMLQNQDLLRSLQTNFEFDHTENNEMTTTEQAKERKAIGKINVHWTVSDTKNISHFILQWHSSKDLHVQQKTIASGETATSIDSCDEKHHYVIEIIIVTNEGERHQFEKLTISIPGEPDAPKLWLVKTTDATFTVEWAEPKSYGIPVIGFQLFIAGKKAGDMTKVNERRAEIPSRINRTYQINVCAVTTNRLRPYSLMSETLLVITTPTTNLMPTVYYGNDDGGSTSFDRSVARIIPLQIETVNEEKIHLDWTSFLPTSAIRAYYVHYKCLNNGEVQTMKVSKRFRHTLLRGLRPGFTYGVMVMAVDRKGGVLYTSDKSTVQMNAPPNAPIVSISERENTHVKLEWRPAASYGEVAVVGYKIFVNNRLAAVLQHDQLTYTLTNGRACDIYTVHVQALSNDKNIVSPMSRGVKFAWPGVKPGPLKRIDDGQTGNIILAWEHPQIEDETEKLLAYRLILENTTTHTEHTLGEYDAATQQATIQELSPGQYRLWLDIQTERNRTRGGPIMIMSGRFNSLFNRQTSIDTGRCFNRKQRRLRSPTRGMATLPLRHIQYS